MLTKILLVVIILFYLLCNIGVTKTMSAKEMYAEFVDGQCVIGKYCANIFYLPAWILKFLRIMVIKFIKQSAFVFKIPEMKLTLDTDKNPCYIFYKTKFPK